MRNKHYILNEYILLKCKGLFHTIVNHFYFDNYLIPDKYDTE